LVGGKTVFRNIVAISDEKRQNKGDVQHEHISKNQENPCSYDGVFISLHFTYFGAGFRNFSNVPKFQIFIKKNPFITGLVHSRKV